MAWFYGTFSCGHEGRVNIVGPTKDRQRKADWDFSNLCPNCKEIELKKNLEEKIKKSKEMELPDLKGTDKQVNWALTLRNDFIKNYQELCKKIQRLKEENPERYAKSDVTLEQFQMAFDYIINNKIKASYWIDNRLVDTGRVILDEYYKNSEIINGSTDSNEDEIIDESTVFPENKNTDSVVKISIKTDSVTAEFERNDDFRSLIKGLGYEWNGSSWEKKIKETTGTGEERAAELGNKLLNAGFPISILDDIVRDNAVNGNYEPECKRWIMRCKDTNNFAICWDGYEEELYSKAKMISGARWNKGSMVVDVSHFDEVEDFAEMNGFKFTRAARNLIDTYQVQLASANTVKPAPDKERVVEDKLKKILESSDDILDDLKD